MKKTSWILGAIIIGVLLLWQINSYFELFAVNHTKKSEHGNKVFRVMTYNINATSENDDIETIRIELLGEVVKYSPDILCFQEMSSTMYKSIHASLDSIFGYNDSLDSKLPSKYSIYSKRPIKNYQRYQYITEFDTIGSESIKEYAKKIKWGMPVYSADIEVEPDRWITFFSVHLRSSAYSTARRSMGEDTSWLKGIPLYYENYKDGQKIRNYEADNLRLHLEELEAEERPVIIAGDFNDWSGSYCMNRIRDGLYKDAWWEGGNGFGITYDGWHLKLRLDHILYSHHFKLEKVFVKKSEYSDHRPLIADFTLME